jgi:uncharacterized membrane protein YedE/YeeE
MLPNFSISPTLSAWNPIIGGLVVGGLSQLMAILLHASPLGASGLYPFLGAQLVSRFDKNWTKNAPFYKPYMDMYDTLYIAFGTMLGAYLSSTFGGTLGSLETTQQVISGMGASSLVRSVVGGAFLVWGSRMAGGCTSGHGISGLAQLSVASYVTVASMFAGGVLTAAFL